MSKERRLEEVEQLRAINVTFGNFTFAGALIDLEPAIKVIEREILPLFEKSTREYNKLCGFGNNENGTDNETRRWD